MSVTAGGVVSRSKIGFVVRHARTAPGAVIGGTVLVVILLASFVAPLPHAVDGVNPAQALRGPSGTYWFGTDSNGFDIFSRVIASGHTDLPLAIIGALVAGLVGVPLGLVASGSGQWAAWIVRAMDVLQSFPLLILSFVLIALLGNHLYDVVYAILLVSGPQFVRLVRSEALVVRTRGFVEAAESVGCSPLRVTFRHVLPNVTSIVFSQLSLAAAQALLVISALAFIGVGIKPPTPSWGAMIKAGSESIATGQWWTIAFPGAMIVICVLALNALASGVSDLIKEPGR